MRRVHHHGRALFFAVILGAAGVSTFAVGTARAAPSSGDLQAQATQLAQQIADAQTKGGALDEQINGANLKLANAQQQLAQIGPRLANAQTQVSQITKLIQERARSLYTSPGQVNVLDLSNYQELEEGLKYGNVMAGQDQQLFAQLREAQRSLSVQQTQAQQAAAVAQQQRDAVANTKAQLDANTSQTQQLLAQVNGQIGPLVQQAQATQLAASQAAGQQRVASGAGSSSGGSSGGGSSGGGSSGGGSSGAGSSGAGSSGAGSSGAGSSGAGSSGGGSSGPPPAVAPGAAGAVAFAQSQVGKPYCYAGAGPSCYDCSGLTMAAWGAAGVSLPHFSGAQYSDFPHVPMSQLQPGDLVFPSDPSTHVALYAGGGMIVEATHTGDVVHYWAIRSEFTLAARP
jgi:cell wall-associated NlpC family hydrolase